MVQEQFAPQRKQEELQVNNERMFYELSRARPWRRLRPPSATTSMRGSSAESGRAVVGDVLKEGVTWLVAM